MTNTSPKYQTGQRVKWNRGRGTGEGEVVDVHTEEVTLLLQGTDVKRDARPDKPAYTLRLDDGDTALKSEAELETAKKDAGA